MPCAASPPSTFCQDQVTTSNFAQGKSIAKAALVASQIASPSRSALMKSALVRRTPLVVPFQTKTVSRAGSTEPRSGSLPYGASSTRASASFNCFSTSVAQSLEKDSHTSTSTPRAPSMDHIAISTAPVSDAGTIPSRQSAGMPRMDLESVMTSASFALGVAARWLRPSSAPSKAASDQPGRLAQGPEEKRGLAGLIPGLVALAMMWLPSRSECAPVGGRGPRFFYARGGG